MALSQINQCAGLPCMLFVISVYVFNHDIISVFDNNYEVLILKYVYAY